MRTLVIFAALVAALPLFAQAPPAPTPTQQSGTPALEKPVTAEPDASVSAAKKPTPPPKRTVSSDAAVVEEVIARVNNEIITRSEFNKSRASAEEDARQECSGKCTPEQLQVAIEDRQRNALRDLIDQSLLVQRGKDMGINVEPEVIKRLDQIRIQNKMDSMEALEKAVSSQGLNWEDFKSNIRNSILTQAVISREVGSHITITHDEIEKYYNTHKQDFVRPEQAALGAIEVSTEGKQESEIPELKKKAEGILKRLQDGEEFAELAKRFSDGSTAKQGGYLGVYKRGELSKQLEDVVFELKKGQLSGVVETKQGFLILKVLEHFIEGEQPLPKVENEIMDKLYGERMEPAYRAYLKTLREQSYVVVKPGYQDLAGGQNSEIQEVSATPEVAKDKKKKKFILF